MRSFFRLALILFVVCGAAAGSLAFVNQATQARIAEQARLEKQEALKQVFPGATEFRETRANRQWEALAAGARAGEVLSIKARGYGGPIEIIVGFDLKNRITGVRILSSTETPGLGAKITTAKFLEQFNGKEAGQIRLKKDDPGAGTIDAITAATISSRAVTEAVRATAEALR